MSRDRFFMMREPFVRMDEAQFELALKTSGHIRDVLYEPELLENETISGITFENVSFSKTRLTKLTFKNCQFRSCLFVGSTVDEANFHDCVFLDCNFFRAKFKNVYGKPGQFAKAVRKHEYANIAVSLFQELRDNYDDAMQPEHRREAEYFFQVWSRRLTWYEIRTKPAYLRAVPAWAGSLLYGCLFGYGYRLRNLLLTTMASVAALTIVAHLHHRDLFEENGAVSFVRSLYFTVSTMVTMGAVGFSPASDSGYLFVLLNATCGVVLITASVSAIAKRVAR